MSIKLTIVIFFLAILDKKYRFKTFVASIIVWKMYILRTEEAFRICLVRSFEKGGEDFGQKKNWISIYLAVYFVRKISSQEILITHNFKKINTFEYLCTLHYNFFRNDGFCLFVFSAAAITTKNVFDEGFCHLQKVKLQVFLDCKLNYTSTVYIALAVNRSDISGNLICQCVLNNEASTICHPNGDTTGYYDESSDIFDFWFLIFQTQHTQWQLFKD